MTNLIFNFFKRDCIKHFSYRFSSVFDVFGVISQIAIFFFLTKTFGNKVFEGYLLEYNGDYFSFILIGIAFSNFIGISLSNFINTIQEENSQGTFEYLLISPVSVFLLPFLSSVFKFIYSSFEVCIYLIAGVFIFGANLSKCNIFAGLSVLILSAIVYLVIGILSAAFILLFKRGSPVNWFLVTGFELFGGVYFPIAVLPSWLQNVSYMLPVTYSLNGLRASLLQGHNIFEIKNDIFALLIFLIILLPLSIFAFNFALKKSKINGTLTHI
ncbi:MAG: ABC transporter permease [Candidatus Firestonebacteria bacterium]